MLISEWAFFGNGIGTHQNAQNQSRTIHLLNSHREKERKKKALRIISIPFTSRYSNNKVLQCYKSLLTFRSFACMLQCQLPYTHIYLIACGVCSLSDQHVKCNMWMNRCYTEPAAGDDDLIQHRHRHQPFAIAACNEWKKIVRWKRIKVQNANRPITTD